MALSLYENLGVQAARVPRKDKIDKHNVEYFATFGKNIDSTGNNTQVTNTGTGIIDGWNTAYGRVQVNVRKDKTYFWAFDIEQHHQKYGSVAIGIEQVKGNVNYVDRYFHGAQDVINYAFKSDGKKYSNIVPCGTPFSDRYNAGHVILMLLDGFCLSFCQLTPKFCKQHKIKTLEEYLDYGHWVVAEKEIPKGTYRMAVSMYGRTKMFGNTVHDQSSVKLVRFETFAKENADVDEEDQDVDDLKESEQRESDLKNALIALEKQLAAVQNTYHQRKLADLYYAQGMSALDVQKEIRALQNRLASFGGYLKKTQRDISSILSPDTAQYKRWSIPQMVEWICSLENGAYRSYASVFRTGFKSDHIDNGQTLAALTAADLRGEPFKIKDFMVRKKLHQHFQSLVEGSRGGNSGEH